MSKFFAYLQNISALVLFALTLLVFSSVSSRWLFNYPFSDWFDLLRLLLGIAVFWGIAAACAHDDHIRGDIFWNMLSDRARYWIDLFGRLLILLFLVMLVWKVFDKTLDVRATGEETAELQLKIWPFYAVAWLAMPLAALVMFNQIWSRIRRRRMSEDPPSINMGGVNL